MRKSNIRAPRDVEGFACEHWLISTQALTATRPGPAATVAVFNNDSVGLRGRTVPTHRWRRLCRALSPERGRGLEGVEEAAAVDSARFLGGGGGGVCGGAAVCGLHRKSTGDGVKADLNIVGDEWGRAGPISDVGVGRAGTPRSTTRASVRPEASLSFFCFWGALPSRLWRAPALQDADEFLLARGVACTSGAFRRDPREISANPVGRANCSSSRPRRRPSNTTRRSPHHRLAARSERKGRGAPTLLVLLIMASLARAARVTSSCQSRRNADCKPSTTLAGRLGLVLVVLSRLRRR